MSFGVSSPYQDSQQSKGTEGLSLCLNDSHQAAAAAAAAAAATAVAKGGEEGAEGGQVSPWRCQGRRVGQKRQHMRRWRKGDGYIQEAKETCTNTELHKTCFA
eukprot:1137752-Pelagomonas_calceolata.AAC.5